MLFGISENNWNTLNRTERYRYLRSIGATTDQARKGRDLKYSSAKSYGGTIIKVPKEKKLNLKQRKALWSKIVSYWQKGEKTQAKLYKSFTPYEKEASKNWNKEAIEFNKALWNNLPKEQKIILRWSEAKTHSAGYALVYRHYILGQSWKKAREGIKIDPYVEPDEYQ